MAPIRASTRSKTNTTVKETKETKSPGKKAPKLKSNDIKKPATTSAYFENDSDALDEESDPVTKKRKNSSVKKTTPKKKRKVEEDDDEGYSATSDEAPVKEYDSDALDEEDDEPPAKTKKKGRASKVSPKKTQSPRKKTKKQQESDTEFDDLAEGQEVVGVVVQAPKTGRVPPGQISQNTFDFLQKLKDPACNDRDWFKLHEPVYRLAEKEWKDFVEAFTDVLVEVDPQIPHLPPKDVIHRIYRDIRFSNDKTPYKRSFSASFSRSGRKGIFAAYHISISPGNSLIAGGSWCPGRNELATIRTNIQRSSRRLRSVISTPEFVKFFGKAEPHPKGEKQNVFGMEDELKVAPKGVAKDDKDIDLLKCRSFAVLHKFMDSEVLAPDFQETLAVVARVMQPFVHCLNDMMTISDNAPEDEEEEEEEEEEESAK